MMSAMSQRVKACFSHVPIYGQLVNSSKGALVAALKEVLLATIFSLFPIWFYPVFLSIGGGLPFWETLTSFVNRGELYLYSAALLGPVVYALTKTYGGSDGDHGSGDSNSERRGFPIVWSIRFPDGVWFSVISILVCCSAAFLFGLLRTSTPSFLAVGLDEESTLRFSIFLYGFTLSCMFCVSVYRLNLEDVSERFGEDTRELFDQWRHRN